MQLLPLIEVTEIGQRKIKSWLTGNSELADGLLMRAQSFANSQFVGKEASLKSHVGPYFFTTFLNFFAAGL